MKKRYLPELTQPELEKVIDANAKIREEITDLIISDVIDRFNSEIRRFKYSVRGYCINGGVYRGHITVSDAPQFIKDLNAGDEFKYMITDDLCDLLDRLTEKADFYEDCLTGYEDISDTRFNNLEKWFEEGTAKIAQCIADMYDSEIEYAYEDERIKEFADIYAETNDDIYILDDTFTAYRDYTECYA